MTTFELAAYTVFTVYLLAFLALTRGVARAGADPWLFARAGGVQTITGWTFRLGFALLLATPLVHVLAPELAVRVDPWPSAIAAMGAALAAGGAGLALWAQAHMGGSWRIGATEDRVGALVSDGPFAWSRNPVFLGQIILVWGMALASGDALVGGLAAAVTLAALTQASVEERILRASLGEAYRTYCGRVPRWVGRPRSQNDASLSQ